MNNCGIYIIEALDKNSDKMGHKYVGQSIDAKERKREHFRLLGKKTHYNPRLQHYYNKYGKDSLNFIVIGNYPEKDLNFWEKFFIKCFDSINNGFNVMEGGENPPLRCKPCKMQNMDTGEIVEFPSIIGFRRKYLKEIKSTSSVVSVVNGKGDYVGDWFSPIHRNEPPSTEVIDPTGKKHKIFFHKISKFCKQHNLDRHNLYRVAKGLLRQHKGWTSPNFENKPELTKPGKQRIFKLISPDGKIVEGINLRKFARENSLNYKSLHTVSVGLHNSHRGWTLYKE